MNLDDWGFNPATTRISCTGGTINMEGISVVFNKLTNTLDVWFEDPEMDCVSEETGDGVILKKINFTSKCRSAASTKTRIETKEPKSNP